MTLQWTRSPWCLVRPRRQQPGSFAVRILLVVRQDGSARRRAAGQYGCEVAGRHRPGVAAAAAPPTPTAGPAPASTSRSIFRPRHSVVTNARRCAARDQPGVGRTDGAARSGAAAGDRGFGRGIGRRAPNFSTGVVVSKRSSRTPRSCSRHRPTSARPARIASRGQEGRAVGHRALLKRSMSRQGFRGRSDVAATRAGFIPGTHTIGFDGPAETITMTHAARDRTAFARGALAAAGGCTASRAGSQCRMAGIKRG